MLPDGQRRRICERDFRGSVQRKKIIHHEHTGLDGPKRNGVVGCGLGLIQETAWPHAWTEPGPSPFFSGGGCLHERLNASAPRQQLRTLASNRRTSCLSGACRRPTTSPTCSPDSAEYASHTQIGGRVVFSTSTRGEATCGTAQRSSPRPPAGRASHRMPHGRAIGCRSSRLRRTRGQDYFRSYCRTSNSPSVSRRRCYSTACDDTGATNSAADAGDDTAAIHTAALATFE